MIKKITKRTLVILFAVLLYMAFFKIAEVNAMSVEEARKNIADLAISFQDKNCEYNLDDCYNKRAWTYNNMKPDDDSGNAYTFDCVGFVTYIVHYATGLMAPNDLTGSSWDGKAGFIHPNSIYDTIHFEAISLDEISPGDLLRYPETEKNGELVYGHVAIYAGDNYIVDMVGSGLKYRPMDTFIWTEAARLKSLEGAQDLSTIGGGAEIVSPKDPIGTTKPSDDLDYDAEIVDLDKLQFDFNGMPITVVNAGGLSFMYFINKIADAFDYLFGILLNGFKVVPVGIAIGLENWTTSIFDGLNNVTENTDIYTIEDLVFNHIAALDPNVFSNTAGGQDVGVGSAVDIIRNAIAIWYVSLRNVALIALCIIVIYIGIRMAMSTSASSKANYKGMLINWVLAVLMVCIIHFIMVVVLNLNGNLVDLLSNGVVSEKAIYETIRTRTWDLRVSVGFPAAVIYVVLFIFYIKFMWVYIKRLFTLLILIALAPLIGVKYAIESAKTGRKSKAFSDWVYDFTMNTLLQSMHAIIYAAIMPIALDLSTKSIIGYIIGLVFINFILKADKIFMNIFNFEKGKNVQETSEPMKEPKKQFAPVIVAASSAATVAGFGKDVALWGGRQIKFVGKKAYRSAAKKYDKTHEGDVRKRNKERINKLHDKYDNALNSVHRILTGEDSNYRVLSVMSRQKGSLGRAAKKQLKKAKATRKKKYSAPFKFIRSSTGNALKIAFGIPAMVVSPKVGLNSVISGVTGNIKMSTAKDDKGHKYKGKEGVKQFATLGTYGTQKEISKSEQKVDKAVKYIKDISNKEEEIKNAFKDTFGTNNTEAAKKYKKDISYILTYGEEENINMLLRERLNVRGILKIDDSNADKTIDVMVDDVSKRIGLEEQYTDAKVKEIRKKMSQKAKEIYNEKKTTNNMFTQNLPNNSEPKGFGAAEIAKGFADAIIEKGIETKDNKKETLEKYNNLTREIMNLHDINKKAQKDLKTSVLSETEFIKSLNRKKGSTDRENRFI